MSKLISLKEHMLKSDLKRAEEKLAEVRILISNGKYELVDKATQLENIIELIEEELIHMMENDLLF
jgi:ribosomal protein L19E